MNSKKQEKNPNFPLTKNEWLFLLSFTSSPVVAAYLVEIFTDETWCTYAVIYIMAAFNSNIVMLCYYYYKIKLLQRMSILTTVVAGMAAGFVMALMWVAIMWVGWLNTGLNEWELVRLWLGLGPCSILYN